MLDRIADPAQILEPHRPDARVGRRVGEVAARLTPSATTPMRHIAPSFRSPTLQRAATTSAAIACLGGCFLGIGRRPSTTLEVRNDADIAANLYVLPRAGLGEVFLGQVGPGASRTVRIRNAAAGDTIALQARPIDGRPVSTRDRLVLGPGVVWRFP